VQLEAIARPYLHELRELTKETVKLAVPSGRQALIIAAEESPFELHTRGDTGHRCPLHSTSLGKTMLAFMPATIARSLIHQHGLPAITAHTITSWDRMEGELAAIRKSGMAIDLEENEIGVRCASAPVRDVSGKMVAAISVSGPTVRITEDGLRKLAGQAKASAEAISQAFVAATASV
jgi:DNA-binding IclR family transcriptional regulator